MAKSATPWTVRTTKRRTHSSGPEPRKRRRTMADEGTRGASTARDAQQKTLTQIQFLPRSSPSSNQLELQQLETTSGKSAKRSSGTGLPRANSTLTQMDFLAKPTSIIVDLVDDNMQVVINNDERTTGSNAIAQLDGSPDSTRQVLGSASSRMKRKSMNRSDDETEEYRPWKRKRKVQTVFEDGGNPSARRRSNRIARLHEPASKVANVEKHNGDSVVEGLTRPAYDINSGHKEDQSKTNSEQGQRMTGIQGQEISHHGQSVIKDETPKTPHRRREIIPSSQSPESLPPPSTKRRGAFGPRTPWKSTTRSPLRDRSTNTLTKPMLVSYKGKPLSPLNKRPHSKRPVWELALTRQNLELVEAQGITEQHLLDATTSSFNSRRPGTQRSRNVSNIEDSSKRRKIEVNDELEIPETSQVEIQKAVLSSPPRTETQDTLPSIDTLLGNAKAINKATPAPRDDQRMRIYPDVLARDFATEDRQCKTPSIPHESSEESLFNGPSTPQVNASSRTDVQEDKGDDVTFSPCSSIANDTQFNLVVVAGAASSPLQKAPAARESQPQLKPQESSSSGSQSIASSPPEFDTPRQYHVPGATTVVPLNDLPSQTLPPYPTQRSLAPASLPHPSQISTQDPTQSCLPTSSMAFPRSPTTNRPGHTAIVIKDSSSMHVPLNDLPSSPHSQPLIDLGLDDLQFRYDNLDPQSSDAADATDVRESHIDKHGHVGEAQPALAGETEACLLPLPFDPRNCDPRDLGISSSLLESLPGPPGWSQRSFDDELISYR